MKTTLPFLAWLRQRLFRQRVDHEIFYRLVPHIQKESRHDYPFVDADGMVAEAEALNLHTLIDEIEVNVRQMPRGYGEAYRYLMHRDMHARLTQFARLAQRRLPPRLRTPRYASECA